MSSSAWLTALQRCMADNVPCVLVTVAEIQGSTPRPAGTKMLVTTATLHGTIGGGNLEYRATEIAREMINNRALGARLERFPLGASLGQCCGGVVQVLFEPLSGADFRIWLFGAGHVGKALVTILGGLPCQVTWVDSREEQFPTAIPDNVQVECSDGPEDDVDDAPPGSYFLVMTHSHDQDYRICERALARDDFAYLGLIGSAAKRRQFEKRLTHRGHGPDYWTRLICPIGIDGIPGKHPGEIAVAVVAELLQVRTQIAVPSHPAP